MVGIFAFQYVIRIIELPEMLIGSAFVLILNYYWLSQILHLDTAIPITLATIFAISFIFYKKANKCLRLFRKNLFLFISNTCTSYSCIIADFRAIYP
jgi:hypothetical protein